MPQEDEVYQFRDNEDEENLLIFPPSGSHGVTVTKENISTLRREGIVVDSGNYPAPENVFHSKDVLSDPEKLNL